MTWCDGKVDSSRGEVDDSPHDPQKVSLLVDDYYYFRSDYNQGRLSDRFVLS